MYEMIVPIGFHKIELNRIILRIFRLLYSLGNLLSPRRIEKAGNGLEKDGAVNK